MGWMGYEARKAAGADEALGEAARNLRAAGDQLDDMLEFVRLVHRVRRAKPPVADDER